MKLESLIEHEHNSAYQCDSTRVMFASKCSLIQRYWYRTLLLFEFVVAVWCRYSLISHNLIIIVDTSRHPSSPIHNQRSRQQLSIIFNCSMCRNASPYKRSWDLLFYNTVNVSDKLWCGTYLWSDWSPSIWAVHFRYALHVIWFCHGTKFRMQISRIFVVSRITNRAIQMIQYIWIFNKIHATREPRWHSESIANIEDGLWPHLHWQTQVHRMYKSLDRRPFAVDNSLWSRALLWNAKHET